MAKNIDGYFQLVYASMRRRWWLCCDDDTFAGNSQEIRLLLKYKIEIGLVCCGVLWCAVVWCMYVELRCVGVVTEKRIALNKNKEKWRKKRWKHINWNGNTREMSIEYEKFFAVLRTVWGTFTKPNTNWLSSPFFKIVQFITYHLENAEKIGWR